MTPEEIEFLSSKAVRDFITGHEQVDISGLVLNPPAAIRGRQQLVAQQIKARRKVRKKIPEWLNGSFLFPKTLSLEQSSSSETARYKSKIFQGEQMVDLTGGMGVDCLALSNVFSHVTYVERDEDLCRIFEHNKGQHPILVENTGALQHLRQLADIEKVSIYLDPARRHSVKGKVKRLSDCEPNPLELLPFLEKASQVLIKTAPLLDIKAALRDLQIVAEVHVVAVRGEVKEVLYLLRENGRAHPPIHCVNLSGTGHQKFTFTFEEEEDATIAFGDPKKYLLDPNSAILKGGAFKTIASCFGLTKVASNTHLYTASEKIRDFPGRTFRIVQLAPDKKELAAIGKFNVVLKNYPQSTADLVKKYRIRDSGEDYLIGFRLSDGTPQLAICQLCHN